MYSAAADSKGMLDPYIIYYGIVEEELFDIPVHEARVEVIHCTRIRYITLILPLQ